MTEKTEFDIAHYLHHWLYKVISTWRKKRDIAFKRVGLKIPDGLGQYSIETDDLDAVMAACYVDAYQCVKKALQNKLHTRSNNMARVESVNMIELFECILSYSQMTILHQWMASRASENDAGRYEFRFVPDGVGLHVIVKDLHTGDEIDVTEQDDFDLEE